jgi:hypothetical protein
MKKFVNIIKKSREITKKFASIVRNKHSDDDDDDKRHGNKHHHNHELDDHNDSSNWSYN